jgi:hypothetical protein
MTQHRSSRVRKQISAIDEMLEVLRRSAASSGQLAVASGDMAQSHHLLSRRFLPWNEAGDAELEDRQRLASAPLLFAWRPQHGTKVHGMSGDRVTAATHQAESLMNDYPGVLGGGSAGQADGSANNRTRGNP